jgi:hypothetical protein
MPAMNTAWFQQHYARFHVDYFHSIFKESSLTCSLHSLRNNSKFDNPAALGLFSVRFAWKKTAQENLHIIQEMKISIQSQINFGRKASFFVRCVEWRQIQHGLFEESISEMRRKVYEMSPLLLLITENYRPFKVWEDKNTR